MSETGIEIEGLELPKPKGFIDGILWGLSIVMLVDAASVYFGKFA